MYHFREVTLTNQSAKERVLVIDFEDKEKKIIGEFLMTDASLLHYQILEDLYRVLAGKSSYIAASGNRCSLEIRQDKTVVKDLFEGMFSDFTTLPTYAIDTKELRNLILIWREKEECFNKLS